MEFNFVSNNVSQSDVELFFQPLFADEFIQIQDHWIMAHIMYEAGIFPSISQSRKNGWNKPIPDGFWCERIGKKRIQITILNKVE